MTTAIHIDGISKWFERHDSPKQRFLNFFRPNPVEAERLYALHDIRFDIPKGTAFGLLGRNGAGKSTLMQIIAGIMRPSEGTVWAGGRISPLLELGTGFNPEFTGIENVRLNATVLGLSPAEIRHKEQAIADFADIGEFINRPVKTYSSGMFARLAFAVAINVDPEILLVDEILAVGDMGFQQKCLNRLREMREEGLTLVFVSHSPDSVKSVCDQALFLDHGQMMYLGDADRAVDRYLAFIREQSNEDQLKHEEAHPWKRPVPRHETLNAELRYGSGHVQIVRVDVLGTDDISRRAFKFGEKITTEIEIESCTSAENLSVNLHFRDDKGLDIFGTTTFDERFEVPRLEKGEKCVLRFEFIANIRIGSYGAVVSVTRVKSRDYSDAFLFDQAEGIVGFEILPDINRPVHYKFHLPMTVSLSKESRQAGADSARRIRAT